MGVEEGADVAEARIVGAEGGLVDLGPDDGREEDVHGLADVDVPELAGPDATLEHALEEPPRALQHGVDEELGELGEVPRFGHHEPREPGDGPPLELIDPLVDERAEQLRRGGVQSIS